MGIRGIVFDIGGVLEIAKDGSEPTGSFPVFLQQWETRIGLPAGELGTFFTAEHEGGQIGAYTYPAFQQRLKTHARMTDEQLAAFLRAFWDLYLGTFNAELADRLRRWRGRYRTGLLSNSFVGAREREQERFGMADLTEVIVYSHEVGVAKPDPSIYELTCKLLGLRPEDTIFLDDVPAYVEGAREAGMKAIRYENNAQALAAIETLLESR